MILVGAVLVFFLAMMFIFQQNLSDKAIEKRNFIINELALTVQNELNIAAKATDGYTRHFTLPGKIQGLDYNITLIDDWIHISTLNGEHALSLPGQNTTGQFIIGANNTIRKIDSIIYLN